MDLKDRVALVTGVGRRAGIGAAIARELARAGAKVFVSFLRRYDEAQSWGGDAAMPEALLQELRSHAEADGCELDLSDPTAPAALFAAARRRFGRVDILVNNAAHWEAGGIERVDASQLDRHFAVNARAAVLLCAEFARHKVAGSPGRIVNITSGQGLGPMPGELAYAVTKAALDALTVSLSAELADRHITVNAVDPGPTDTGWMTASVKAALEAAIADRHRGVAAGHRTRRQGPRQRGGRARHRADRAGPVQRGTAVNEPGFDPTWISNSLRPQLAGDEQPLRRGVVGDAVQHRLGLEAVGRHQAAQIDPADDAAGLRRDAGDPVGVPHVGPHLAAHELQLVQLIDRHTGVAHRHPPDLAERLRIEEAQVGGAVAENQAVRRRGQPPAFAGIPQVRTGAKVARS